MMMNFVYMLRCSDGTLYTGWTKDLNHRVVEHNAGIGAKYTRSRLPVRLVYCEEYEDKRQAQRREYAIKRFTKKEKERMILMFPLYFYYDREVTEYLKRKDKRLGAAIDVIGHINREVEVNDDLFSSVVYQMIGQQISSVALKTVWLRLVEQVGLITVESIHAASREDIQACGISFRKTDYIKSFTDMVYSGKFDLEILRSLPDAEVIERLSSIKGIGVWTAEMLMIFCMQRPDVLSFGDLGIQRGLRMLYHHRKIDRKRFNTYLRRFSPYGTVASLYLWAIAGGAIPEMRDYAPKKVK